MPTYSIGRYTSRISTVVDASQFDGTYAHARWLAERNPETLTVVTRPLDRASGLTDDSPARLSVSCWDGMATAEKGDWIVVDEDGDWRVCSDEEFQAECSPAE